MDFVLHTCIFLFGLFLVISTFSSALSTFVVPRSVRSRLNRLVFVTLRRIFQLRMNRLRDYESQDALMAYYAPLGLVSLVPTWYVLVAVGYSCMYWALGVGDWLTAFRLSGSSLLTLGFAASEDFLITIFIFSEATVGLTLVALLIAYLPTMYAAFSRREQAVNLLEIRAGSPPSSVEMILRFNRIHGLDQLNNFWVSWETWFADVEESHTLLPALVFFRSPRPYHSWVTAAGAVLDAAALTVSAVDIPKSPAAQLTIRAGYIALRQIVDYYEIPYPKQPSYPKDPISISREEFDQALDQLAAGNVPLKADRDQAWTDYAGWRVNYDVVLLAMCSLTMAPLAPWSSDRAPHFRLPPLIVSTKRRVHQRIL